MYLSAQSPSNSLQNSVFLLHRLGLVAAALLMLPLSGLCQYQYYVDKGVARITKYTGPGGAVTIPSSLGGYPVKSIEAYAFDKSPKADLTLTSLVIPNSVTNIGDRAFNYCYNLTNVNFGTGLISIGWDAFDFCTSLKKVTLPNSATNLGIGAFASCENLTEITLPPKLPRISAALLGGCSKLGKITIPSTVTSIDAEAFSSCWALTNVVIPTGVTNIDWNAFNFCLSLKKIEIPDKVINIGYRAFGLCYALESLSIPKSVRTIGDQAFYFCGSLTNISVDPLNPSYSSVDGVLFDKSVTTLLKYPEGRPGDYVLPSTALDIPISTFAFCTNLTSVTFPAGVTEIKESTFNNASGLNRVSLPDTLKTIGLYAFQFSGLKNIAIPNSVTNLGPGSFEYCPNLTSVTIPASIRDIGSSAFSVCSNLTTAYFLGDAPTIDGRNGGQDFSLFAGFARKGTVLYVPGTKGWQKTYGTWPTKQGSFSAIPNILSISADIQSQGFEFEVRWIPDTYVVVEASTNLLNWTPIATNTLSSETITFTDTAWTSAPHQFYRVR